MLRYTDLYCSVDESLLIHLVNAVDRIEKKLAVLEGTQADLTWISPEDFQKLAGIGPQALKYAVQSGIIHGDALTNIGTVKRHRYRYHRQKALDQYLSRSPTQ